MIRSVRPEDRAPIRKLLVATDVFSEDELDIALELVDAVLGSEGHKDYIIRVCEEERVVAGYYCIGPTPATEATFDLYWIAVDPAFQRRGIGELLEQHALESVREMGGRLLIAETSSQPRYDRTRRFYVRRGYAELARIKEYYRPGDDLVVYGKYLTPSQER